MKIIGVVATLLSLTIVGFFYNDYLMSVQQMENRSVTEGRVHLVNSQSMNTAGYREGFLAQGGASEALPPSLSSPPPAIIAEQPLIETYRAIPQLNIVFSELPIREPVAPLSSANPPSDPNLLFKPMTSKGSPFENNLWHLLGQQRFAELLQLIKNKQLKSPAYQPPQKIRQYLQQWQIIQAIESAIREQNWWQLTQYQQQYSLVFNCERIDFLWALADAFYQLDQINQVNQVYQTIMLACANDQYTHVSVQLAIDRLPYIQWRALIDFALLRVIDVSVKKKLTQLKYEQAMQAFYQAYQIENYWLAVFHVVGLEHDILRRSDIDFALNLGWAYYHLADYQQAEQWFLQLWQWAPKEKYALALIENYFVQNNSTAAENFMVELDNPWQSLQQIMVDLWTNRAVQAYQDQRYLASIQWFSKVKQLVDLADKYNAMLAWAYFHQQAFAAAEPLFAALYRNNRDQDSASGFFYACLRQGQNAEMSELATLDGPLRTLIDDRESERAYHHKLYYRALSYAPERFPELRHIDSPYVPLGLYYRLHRGGADNDLSRHELWRLPMAELVLTRSRVNRWWLQLATVQMSSGRLRPNQMVGVVPSQPTAYSFSNNTYINAGLEPTLGYEHEAWVSSFIALGLTASNTLLDEKLVWRAGITQQINRGYWRALAYSRQVDDSVLAYTGLRDPYSGLVWGQVLQTGAQFSWVSSLSKHWYFYTELDWGQLQGENVADNESKQIKLSLHREWQLELLWVLSYGPYLGYTNYTKNLSHFTMGQGGYFSPQDYIEFGGWLGLRTKPGRSWLLNADLRVDWVRFNQAASPFFPLSPDGRVFAADNVSGVGFNFKLQTIKRLAPKWQVGAAVDWQASPQHSRWALQLSTRWNYQDRGQPLNIDFPNFNGQ